MGLKYVLIYIAKLGLSNIILVFLLLGGVFLRQAYTSRQTNVLQAHKQCFFDVVIFV